MDSSWLVGASGKELLLGVEVVGQPYQCSIDSGASLTLVKPGVSQAEVRPMDTAARGITGAKLKSISNETTEVNLSSCVYNHEFLEYSGVVGLDISRPMEAKVDLCSSGLIIRRRRYELRGLDCHDRDSSPVAVKITVVRDRRKMSKLISR